MEGEERRAETARTQSILIVHWHIRRVAAGGFEFVFLKKQAEAASSRKSLVTRGCNIQPRKKDPTAHASQSGVKLQPENKKCSTRCVIQLPGQPVAQSGHCTSGVSLVMLANSAPNQTAPLWSQIGDHHVLCEHAFQGRERERAPIEQHLKATNLVRMSFFDFYHHAFPECSSSNRFGGASPKQSLVAVPGE